MSFYVSTRKVLLFNISRGHCSEQGEGRLNVCMPTREPGKRHFNLKERCETSSPLPDSIYKNFGKFGNCIHKRWNKP